MISCNHLKRIKKMEKTYINDIDTKNKVKPSISK